MMVFALFLIALALTACSPGTIEQNLRPDQQTVTAAGPQQKKRQGLVVTDNPYMISSDRLEKMNKGGFGGY
jgi:hypothetical protein